MTCQGCSNTSSASNEMLRDEQVMAAFNVFWPRSAAFPPSMPWLGALLSRSGAYYWLSAFPDTAKSLAQNPAYGSIASFISWSLYDAQAEAERSERCKKNDFPPTTNFDKCLADACKICGSCGNAHDIKYNPNTGWCSYWCGENMPASDSDGKVVEVISL